MYPVRISPLPLLALLLMLPVSAFAQTYEDELEKVRQAQAAAIAAAQQQQAQREQADREKSQKALRDFLNTPSTFRRISAGPSAELEYKFYEFRLAIPKFRRATDEFRMAIGLNSKLDKHLKNIETQTDVMLRYLTAAKMKHPRPEAAEFKDYTRAELAWETLNTAEHIGAFLDLAVAVERQDVIATKSLEFLYTLDGQLLRLKWLTTHIK